MIRFPGKQSNTYKYYFDGYIYYADSRNQLIFRCGERNRGCQAALYSDNFNSEVANINPVGNHNHMAEPDLLIKMRFLGELLDSMRTTFEDPKTIFESTLNNQE